MRIFKYIKNKKVLALVLSAMMTFSSLITTKAMTKTDYQNNKTIIETNVKCQKNIGIKTQRTKRQSVKRMAGVPMQVGATAYYGDKITFTGTTPIVGKTIAVDPNIIPYGTRVYIPQFNKIFIAEDCGSAIKGNRIDIFMNSYDECMEWGYKTITIYILED